MWITNLCKGIKRNIKRHRGTSRKRAFASSGNPRAVAPTNAADYNAKLSHQTIRRPSWRMRTSLLPSEPPVDKKGCFCSSPFAFSPFLPPPNLLTSSLSPPPHLLFPTPPPPATRHAPFLFLLPPSCRLLMSSPRFVYISDVTAASPICHYQGLGRSRGRCSWFIDDSP